MANEQAHLLFTTRLKYKLPSTYKTLTVTVKSREARVSCTKINLQFCRVLSEISKLKCVEFNNKNKCIYLDNIFALTWGASFRGIQGRQHQTCADPESFVRAGVGCGGPALATFFKLMRGGGVQLHLKEGTMINHH